MEGKILRLPVHDIGIWKSGVAIQVSNSFVDNDGVEVTVKDFDHGEEAKEEGSVQVLVSHVPIQGEGIP